MARLRIPIAVGLATSLLGTIPWARAGGLSPREAAGKEIYTRGESPSGAGISATIGGDVVLPASQAPCASCHGGDGLGRQEGGADPGRITWSHLTKSYGHVHPDGRRHPPFDERSLGRAIRKGIDPAGNPLAPAMPRFSISSEDLGSLVAYLRRIETDTDPGVRERKVRVGTVVPTRGRLAPVGEAIRTVLEGTLRGLDATGGVHGRRVELVVAGYGDERGGAAAGLERLAAGGELFALVAPFAPGAEEAVEAVARRHGLPVIGPITPYARVEDPPDPGLFFVAGGLGEEVRALSQWAGRSLGTRGRAAILAPAGGGGAWAAAEGRRALAAAGLPQPLEIQLPRPAAEVVRRLRAAKVGVVLYVAGDDELAAFAGACARARYTPELLLPATLAARAAVDLPRPFAGKVHVAFASIPSDVTEAGRRRLESAGGRLGPGNAAQPAQLAAFQSAGVLLEGLRRAGRHLTRERLIEAIEGIYRLETGVGPPITYGPGQRLGSPGAWVVEADLPARTYGASSWVALDRSP